MVTLTDGSQRDRVYFADAMPWYQSWGVWPEEDAGKTLLPLERVSNIFDSPSRLPKFAADKLYAAGESGMGYSIFTVLYKDGTRQVVGLGTAVDFITFPVGKLPTDVLDVPHEGRNDPGMTYGPDYQWCLYHGILQS